MEPTTNPQLQLAFDFVQNTNRHIFLTGKAGTGKTTFLHTLKKSSPKRMIVVAPTGVAAINAGGVTIHSFFQLPFHPHVPSQYTIGADPAPPGLQPERSARHKINREKINIIRTLDLLIIDEISMVRADLLDAIDAVLRRYKDRHRPFGGVQLLMIGDIQQLAPVVKDQDWEILKEFYTTAFFFGSRALAAADYVTIELQHIYRQRDERFINLLNKIRDNRLDDDACAELDRRYDPQIHSRADTGFITLTTHNAQADTLNDSKLAQLPGALRSFAADIQGEFPEYSWPAPGELLLKPGAQVMFVRNDQSREKLFFNGKIGTVMRFEDDAILVKCPDDNGPIVVERTEWQNTKYAINAQSKEIEENVAGTFTQYPLRLAWAITIHKSQGLTFDRAIIDARSAFAHGQVYVALSRCRTLEGLVLSSPVNQRGIISDSAVSGFVSTSRQRQPDQSQLDESVTSYQATILLELFDFSPIARGLHYCIRLIGEHPGSITGTPGELFSSMLTAVNTDLIAVSERFQSQLQQLRAADPDVRSNTALQDRIIKAAAYFSEKLSGTMQALIDGIQIESDNSTVLKSVTQAIERVRQETIVKRSCLSAAKNGFTVREYLEAKARGTLEPPLPSSAASRPQGAAPANVAHPELYNRLKQWRFQKADDGEVPHYMILPQRTMVALATILPQSLRELTQVKGIGRKKLERFGEELIGIIALYCREQNITHAVEHTADQIAKQPEKTGSKKQDTKQATLELFESGVSVPQIAAQRSMAVSTIEGHLAHYVGTGKLPVDALVSAEITTIITDLVNKQGTFQLGPIKAELGERVSWGDIRFVVKHLEFKGFSPAGQIGAS